MAKTVAWKLTYDTTGTQRGAQDAERSLTGLESTVGRVGDGLGALQGRGTSTFSFMASAINSSALSMNPLASGIAEVSGVVDRLGGQLRSAAKDGDDLNKSLLLAGAGAAIAAVGGALEHLSAPLQRSNADLKAAFEGTNQDMSDFQGQIDQTVDRLHKYGITQDDTIEGLAHLTVATKDPTEALAEQNFVVTVATYKHETFAEAADQVAKAHAGNFRSFKEFGINTTDMTKAITDATSAEKALAVENDKLANAQQSLADFEGRMVAQRAAALDSWQAQVDAANQRVADSDQNLADVEQRISDQTIARQQAAADAANAAREAQMSAEERLADLKAQIADKNRPSVQQQYELQHAHEAVDKAQQNLVSGTGSYQDRLQLLTDAQSKLAETEALQADSRKLTLSETQNLTHAEEAVAKAKEGTAAADAKAAAAGEQTRTETVELRKALDAQTKAHEDLADVQAKGATAGAMTLAQQQEERKLRDSVTDATDKQAAAAVDAADKKAKAAEVGAVFAKLEEEVMQRYGTAADDRADTFTGKLSALRARVQDAAATFGEQWAPAIMGVGAALMVVSALTSVGGTIIGFFGASAAGAAVGVDAMAVSEDVAAASAIGLDVALLPIIGTAAAIVAGVVLLGLAVYEIYDHWGEISSWFADRWDNVKNIFTDAKDWIGNKIGEMVDFVTGLPGRLLNLVDDMKTTGWNIIVGLWNGAVGAVGDVLSGFGQLIYDHTIGAAMSWLGISSPSAEAHKIGMFFGQGLANGITGSGDLVVGAVDEVNSRLLGRQLAAINVAANTTSSAAFTPAAGGSQRTGPGASSPTAVEYHTHLHMEKDSINIDAGHIGTADHLVDVVHEGLQRKMARTGDLQLQL